jgi:ATP-dependent Clp protease protease subunit
MTTSKKDFLQLSHDHGVYVPTRTIYLDSSYSEDGAADGVNATMANKFLKNFMYLSSLNKNDITVIINTSGGSCVDGMIIYDTIKTSPIHTTVKVVGEASSMGCIILQAGDYRVMQPNAILMFHAGFGGVGAHNPYEAANSAEFDRRYMEKMYKIVYNRINEKRNKDGKAPMAAKTFETMNLKGRYMFAEEALEDGLIDEIEKTYDKVGK